MKDFILNLFSRGGICFLFCVCITSYCWSVIPIGFSTNGSNLTLIKQYLDIEQHSINAIQTIFSLKDYSTNNNIYNKNINDTITYKINSSLKNIVEYHCDDSIQYDLKNQKIYLWKNATANYKKTKLSADFIEIDLKKNIITAKGIVNPDGTISGNPKFNDKGQDYFANEILYNYKTEKGIIKKVKTKQGSGYIHGKILKKVDENIFLVKDGKYTTCNLDNPHFYIKANKIKVIKDDKIITGPANLNISNIPTPLAIPFGFFPNKRTRQSGILIPSYGHSNELGYFLNNGGFYIAFNNYVSNEFRGDVYINGSWTAKNILNYKKKYKSNGYLKISYTTTKKGDPDELNYATSKSYNIKWHHIQDTKANPKSSFLADVNTGSSDYFVNNLTSPDKNFLQPNFNSTIRYTKKIGSKFNLNASVKQSQNRNDSSIVLNLPDINFSMLRVLPFQKNIKFKNISILKNFGFSYNSKITNKIQNKESDFFSSSSIDTMKNAIQHNIPISMSLKILKNLTVNSTANLTETWYFKTIKKSYNTTTNAIVKENINGFSRFLQTNLSASLTTKIYGTYLFKTKKLKAIRHIITPNISYTFRPDLGKKYYHTIQSDTNGNNYNYTIFEGGLFGVPSLHKTGVISFNLINNLEAKYLSKDSAKTEKKIKLIDYFSFKTRYNINADSLNWSLISMDARTQLGKFLNLQFRGFLDSYSYNGTNGERINKSLLKDKNKYLRVTELDLAVGISLKSSKNKNKKDENKILQSKFPDEYDYILRNKNAYVDFNIPWNLSVKFRIKYKPNFIDSLSGKDRRKIIKTLNFNGSVNITKNWKVSISSGYDMENQEFTYTRIDVFRDLHCWKIDFSTVPIGSRTNYTFFIGVKAPILQDLKIQRKRNWFDN